MSNTEDTKKNILEQIDEGQVSMKPKMYFILRACAISFFILITTLLTLFLISFVAFVLQAQGFFLFAEFGFRGLLTILLSVPWILVGFVIAFVVVLELLARNFAFIYRKPLIYSILGIIVFVTFAGGAIAATPLHKTVYDEAQKRSLPFASEKVYQHYGKLKARGGDIGVVRAINETGLIVRTPSGEISVSTTTKTRYPKERDIKEGDRVLLIGEKREDGIFEAYGIRPVRETIPPHILHKRL